MRRPGYKHRQRPFGPTDGRPHAGRFVREGGCSGPPDEGAGVTCGARRASSCPRARNPLPNRRNGSSPETATTESGKVLPGIPRHRNGGFDPIPIAKDRWRLPEVDTQDPRPVRARHDDPRQSGPDRGDPRYRGYRGLPEHDLRNRRRGDGRSDGLGKPVAGAHAIRSSSWKRSGSIFAGVEHGWVRRLGHPARWNRGRLRPAVSGQ